ncbi:feline leukemia virus subgroup C receptor-related protein 2-like isoform 2 [Planoprotostelium fungivorum]|uniref:Feline leukemia virus subgroup C receptor-related protein 2-like isoform 2 n=1 Tax=Planoprotostelium fungivorum TaxID=1890364 RepID=A0A2P6N585_9EUKA|nr:feline leukemia virus subgroup C receptor-related protein 2-like isoform 2 [Planoprotostelium fungivorum]
MTGKSDPVNENSPLFVPVSQNQSPIPSADPESPKIESDVEPHPIPRRWLVLLVFFSLSVSNNFMEFSFSPVSKLAQAFYHVDEFQLTLLALVFMVSGCTTRFAAMYIIDSIGLGIGTFIAAGLHLLGVWVRYYPGEFSYGWLLGGQILTAVAQGFIDITGPKVAANWFPPRERTTATAAGGGSIFVAALLSYTIVPRLVNSPEDFSGYLLVQAVISSVAVAGIFLFFRGSPPIPPSLSASVKKVGFLHAMKSLITNIAFLNMALIFSITIGTGVSILILLDPILEPYGYTTTEAGNLASIWIAASVLGGAVGGPLVDRTHAFKIVILISLLIITGSLLVFTAVLETIHSVIILGVIFVVAGFGTAGMPALLEATVEIIYPVPEATAMGLLFFGLNVMSFFLSIIIIKLKMETSLFRLPLLLCTGICAIGCVLVLFLKPQYNRLIFERQERERLDRRQESVNGCLEPNTVEAPYGSATPHTHQDERSDEEIYRSYWTCQFSDWATHWMKTPRSISKKSNRLTVGVEDGSLTNPEQRSTVKCIVVGDRGIGKSTFCLTYVEGVYPGSIEWQPPTHHYTCSAMVDEIVVQLNLIEVHPDGGWDILRPLTYSGADCIIICFSMDSKASLESVTDKWYPEIKSNAPTTPTMLVGLRSDLNEQGQEQAVTKEEAIAVAQKIEALHSFECSSVRAKRAEGKAAIKEVFNQAIRSAVTTSPSLVNKRKSHEKQCRVM